MDVIIGAGITGLAYANFTRHPYIILEKDDHTGGYCNTIHKDGLVWDYSGHFFHFQTAYISNFVMQRIETEGLTDCIKKTQIYYKGKLIDFPFQTHIHQLPKAEYEECIRALNNAPVGNPANFKDMLYMNFGSGIAEKFLIPYNEKLYAIDLNKLDVDAMGRFFPRANKSEILHCSENNDASSYNAHFAYHKNGAIEYVRALERDLYPTCISLGEEVLSIDTKRKVVVTNKREIAYDNVISTLPLPKLLDLCGMTYDKRNYSWNKVLVFNLGFDKKGAEKTNHWIYFPEKKYCFYRVGFYSNIIPADRMSLYVEVGFRPSEQIDTESMLAKVLHDLREAGIVNDEQLVAWHSVVMNPGYVHISRQSIEQTRQNKRMLAENGIFSIGRYGSWNYSSIEDNIKEAMQLAEHIC